MEDLTLQIAAFHDIGIDNHQMPDSRGGEVKSRGRAERTRADAENFRVEQTLLPGDAELRENDLSRPAFHRKIVRQDHQKS